MKRILVFLILIILLNLAYGQAHYKTFNGVLGGNLLVGKFPTIDFTTFISDKTKAMPGFQIGIKSYLKEIKENLYIAPSVSVSYFHSSREDVIVTNFMKGGSGDVGYNNITAWETGLNIDLNYFITKNEKTYFIGGGLGYKYFGIKTEIYDAMIAQEYDSSGGKILLNLIGGHQLGKSVDFEVRLEIGSKINILRANLNYSLTK